MRKKVAIILYKIKLDEQVLLSQLQNSIMKRSPVKQRRGKELCKAYIEPFANGVECFHLDRATALFLD